MSHEKKPIDHDAVWQALAGKPPMSLIEAAKAIMCSPEKLRTFIDKNETFIMRRNRDLKVQLVRHDTERTLLVSGKVQRGTSGPLRIVHTWQAGGDR